MNAKSQKQAAKALQSIFHAMVAAPVKKPHKRSKPKQRENRALTALEAMHQNVAFVEMRGNLTQLQASSVAGCSHSMWWNWEHGVHRAPESVLRNFRARASEMFPNYRCDLRRI